ncbi:DNA-processing protein DprA [Corynebacterium choanae]|uniref:DNA-processing protein DprA n=1 Tax=Corynebacterium choanae TaxID=1862358 RepID=UPI0013DE2C4F
MLKRQKEDVHSACPASLSQSGQTDTNCHSVQPAASTVHAPGWVYPRTLWCAGGKSVHQDSGAALQLDPIQAASSPARRRVVAVLGSSRPAVYAVDTVTRIVRSLLRDDRITVLTVPVDGIGFRVLQQATTASGTSAIAVVPVALGQVSCRRTAELLDTFAHRGGMVVSRFPPGKRTPATSVADTAMLVAAWADAVVMVDYRNDAVSSLCIAAATACNTPVLAIPGPVDQPGSMGCHRLIAEQQAQLVANSTDIRAQVLPLAVDNTTAAACQSLQQQVIHALQTQPGKHTFAQLLQLSGLPPAVLSRQLVALHYSRKIDCNQQLFWLTRSTTEQHHTPPA